VLEFHVFLVDLALISQNLLDLLTGDFLLALKVFDAGLSDGNVDLDLRLFSLERTSLSLLLSH
jgi:hypothetical protein